MRRCLYVLLILLLPLRAWVGDAMATQMSLPAPAHHAMAHAAVADHGHGGAATDAHAHPAPEAIHTAADDCAGHMAPNDADSSDDAAHCGVCAMCQTCHTVAVLEVVQFPYAGQSRPALPLFAATGFTSADRAPALKPPEA
ncbi:MAG TPA: hypothetical protein PLY50_12610 [Burkholderiaceae bacterium]|jgi:hypothetical protein|nr:hypothetical protein [Burkholderiaceae bacterium]